MSNEIWKDIKGYEGKYQISNNGNVKSLKDSYGNSRELILKQHDNGQGYLQVTLSKDNKRKHLRVNRLVAEAFLPNTKGLPEVNHKNEFEKHNNSVSNLEWCDRKYNSNYGTRSKRAGKNSGITKTRKVFQYDSDLNIVKIWPSYMECIRAGYSGSHISKCCRGKKEHYKGYRWSYKKLIIEGEE